MGKSVTTAMQYERVSFLPRANATGRRATHRAAGARYRRESKYLANLSSWRLICELISRHQLAIVEALLVATWVAIFINATK